MVEQVAKYIRQWHMIEPGNLVIAGVSGGADSVCLCCVLAELSGRLDFTLRVVHVEHGIRGEESVRDAKFVENFCREQGIECVTYPVHVPEYARAQRIGEEEAARLLRYEVFRKEAAKFPGSRIALAHHMEDNAETLLFQMTRGSGIDGMCGIRPVRCDEDETTYIRPLLCVSRQEIELELERRGQLYCTDRTNANLAYSRNRIRHIVLPALKEINTRAVSHLNQTAERMGELRDYIDAQLAETWPRVALEESQSVVLSVTELKVLPHILQIRIVHRALALVAGAKRDIEAGHLESVLELMGRQTGRCVDLPYEMKAQRSYDTIRIVRNMNPKEDAGIEVRISEAMLSEMVTTGLSQCVTIEDTDVRFLMHIFPFEGNLSEIPRKIYTKWFDYDKIKFGFSIRTRRNQDYFVMDAEGHRQKLADYFINQKIPAEERKHTLLVANGAEILWIVGGRMGRGAQLGNTSRMILELTYEGGTNDGLQ